MIEANTFSLSPISFLAETPILHNVCGVVVCSCEVGWNKVKINGASSPHMILILYSTVPYVYNGSLNEKLISDLSLVDKSITWRNDGGDGSEKLKENF